MLSKQADIQEQLRHDAEQRAAWDDPIECPHGSRLDDPPCWPLCPDCFTYTYGGPAAGERERLIELRARAMVDMRGERRAGTIRLLDHFISITP